MFHKRNLLILIPVIVLIPLLLAITPLKLVNKMVHTAPFAQSQNKKECSYKNCFSHSLISQNYHDTATVDVKSSDPETSHLLRNFRAVPEIVCSNICIISIPLRC